MKRDRSAATGAVKRMTLESIALRDNFLGDPTTRIIDVYIPAGHDGRGLPLLVDLVGFTAGGPAHTNWRNFTENIPEQADRLIAKHKIKDDDIHVLMMLAMCATYDPDLSAYMGVRLPVDAKTCELIAERWANWMKWDPLTLVETHHAGLKRLKALFIDCGDID